MASSGQEKVTGRLISKQKSGDNVIQIFRSNRGKNKEKSKREKSGVGSEKQTSGQKSAGIDLGKEYPNVIVIT